MVQQGQSCSAVSDWTEHRETRKKTEIILAINIEKGYILRGMQQRKLRNLDTQALINIIILHSMRPYHFQNQEYQHVEGPCKMQILNKLLTQSCKTYCWKGFSTETAEQFTGLSNLHYSRSQQECEDWSGLFLLLPQVVAQWFTTTHWLYFWSVLWHSLWNG